MLEKDKEACCAAVHGITKSGTRLKDYTTSSIGMVPSDNSCKELEVPKVLKYFMNILKFIKILLPRLNNGIVRTALKAQGKINQRVKGKNNNSNNKKPLSI